MKEKLNKNGKIVVTLIVAIAAASLGSLATYFIMDNKSNVSSNIKGTKWFSSYAGQLVIWDFNKDGNFKYTYNGQEVEGQYTFTDEVITVKAEGYADEKFIYSINKDELILSDEPYYSSEEKAKENDEYFYIPEDYDTSMFKTLTANELIEKYNNGDTFFVLWARGSCGHCQNFRPVAAESLNKYNYELYYVNVAALANEDYEKISLLHDSFAQNITATPNIFYVSKNTVKDVLEGYADADKLGKFLTENGVKEK